MGSRHVARVVAFQALYSYNVYKDAEKCLKFNWIDDKLDDDVEIFASSIIRGTIANFTSINDLIKLYSINRDFDRISKVDLAILQISIYQIYFENSDSNPNNVVIDEAVRIAKEYSNDESYKYVNGILDKISKDKNERLSW